jgi:hypothetical protein
MTDFTAYTLFLLAWIIVPPFLFPPPKYPHTLKVQGLGIVAFFGFVTTTAPEDSANHLTIWEYACLVALLVFMYHLCNLGDSKR